MSQGNFTCGDLLEVQAISDNIWADNRTKIDYVAEAEVARRVLENQTATFTELTGDKDRDVSVKWLNACAITVQDCTDDCTISGPELEGACQNYRLERCKESPFSVNLLLEQRTSLYENKEKIAKGLMKAKKALDEYIARVVVQEIDSFAGVNAHTSNFTVSGTDTLIPSSAWTSGLAAYWMLVKMKNKFNAPWLLSGENLFMSNMNAMWNSGNADGKGDAARAGVLPIYFDVFNVDTTLTPDKKTFMIEKGAVALISKAQFGAYTAASPLDLGKHGLRWSEPSMNLPGIVYDVIYDTTCANSEITGAWKVKAFKFDTFLNPTGCTTTNTGVLSFSCTS